MVVLLYRFRVRVVMELTRLLKLLALIILLGYFINKILVAKTKLYDGTRGQWPYNTCVDKGYEK